MPTNTCTEIEPEYFRVEEVKPRFGFSRSTLYELIRDGKIKFRVLRKSGNVRGVRLVSAESLRKFIESLPEH